MSVDKRHLLKSAYNYTQAGQWDRALEEYRKVIRLFPDDPNIHSMIADLLGKKGENVAAAAAHVEAARFYMAVGQDEKELASLRKALRVKAGDAEATAAIGRHFDRALQKAQQHLIGGQLDEADAIGSRLLDADPGHIGANRLVDDLKAARLQAASREAMEEEALIAEEEPGAGDATKEVLTRLQAAATAYLNAEDYDNAMDTLLVMLKLDPASPQLQFQLNQAQDQLKIRQAAQQKWQDMQAKQSAELETVKSAEFSRIDLEAWRDEEEAVQKRLEEEQKLAAAHAQAELSIIENAVRELAASVAPAGATAAAEDQAKLRALMSEREEVQKRATEESELAKRGEQEAEQRRTMEAERLEHAIALAKAEAEAQAKAVALGELEKRLQAEREAHLKELDSERERLKKHEDDLERHLKEMMRSEMEKLRAEVTASTTEQMRAQLDSERKRVAEVEAKLRHEEGAAVAKLQVERQAVSEAQLLAEESARKEREALAKLKKEEDDRRQSFLQEAMKRRQARQGAAGDERTAVNRASRKISDVLHAATTKHLGEDVEAMVETAKRYLKQDLLLDAMRICQKIAEKDPDNEKVKALLKEIYVRKGI
jgi:hypothetical protein